MRKRIPRWGLLTTALAAVLASGLALAHYWPKASPPPESSPAADKLPLEETERQYLWEVEHHGQLLNQKGFRALATALRQADRTALRDLLAANFEGATINDPLEVRLPGDYVQVVRLEDRGNPPLPLNRDEFVLQLMRYRGEFGPEPKVQLALMTLSPASRQDLESPWEGKCILRIWGESAPGSPAEVVLSLSYRVSRPSEELFKGPGWLRACTITQSLVGKAPRPLLREVAAERGIDVTRLHDNWNSPQKISTTGGVFLCDYDRDGILDMLVTDANGCSLYKGLPGGKFTEVPLDLAPGAFGPVVFADLDGDGWDDLIVGNRLYQNVPDGKGGRRFADITWRTNLRIPAEALSAVVADYDRDGRLDIYVTRKGTGKAGSWVTGLAGDGTQNQLWRNKGNWQFEDVTVAAGAGGGNSSTFTAIWLDADNDGWPDLWVINEFGNGRLLMNRGNGTFREVRLTEGAGDFGTMGGAAGDIDNNGYIDLYAANMYSKAGARVIGNLRPDAYPPELMDTIRHFVGGSQLWMNRGGNKFEPRGKDWQVAAVGWAYGPALVDLDNDGFLDIFATAGFMSQNRNEPDG